MPSELADAADVVVVAVFIIVKGMAATVAALVVRAVVALMHIQHDPLMMQQKEARR